MATMMTMEEPAPYRPSKRTTPALGDLVRNARIAAGLTQAALAERVGVSERGISDIERGVIVSPNVATLRTIVSALQLPEDDAQHIYAARGAHAHKQREPRPLRAPLTRLVDRRDDIADVSRLICAPETRLVSLLGPGGIGKSRLALAIANALSRSFSSRAVFVELDGAMDTTQACEQILRSVNVSLNHWKPAHAQVLAALRRREMLLVLDNVEHLPLGTFIVELLAYCPNLRILATSRQPLRLRGEHRYEVGPLALPEPSWVPNAEELEQAPATALFLQCARCLPVDLPLTERNRIDIATICRLAEGVPLRIEHAASLLTAWPLGEIARQMRDPLTCLRNGPADLPERHRSLEASVRWSYDLLSADEQWLLRLLASIDGEVTDDVVHLRARFTMGAPATPLGVAQGLHALVEKHLIRQRRQPDATHYTLPGHIRAFARAQTDLRHQAVSMWAQG